MNRVVIIGSGNVAEAFAIAIAKSHIELVQIVARNTLEGEKIAAECHCGFTSDPNSLEQADLYIIAVSDKAIEPLSEKYDFGNSVVAHTAGSVDINGLSNKIEHKAVLYPLQTFTKGRETNLKDTPLLIEGTTPLALNYVQELANALSNNVDIFSSHQRSYAHLAAVFACNFTNHMYTIAETIVSQANIPFEILKPLIKETALKVIESSSPRLTQTGPAIRNDFKTKNKHCEMLVENADYKNIYINLSKNIWETLKKT